MSNGITLNNPVRNSVPVAVSIGKKAVDVNGLSLSTGKKVNNDVVSSFLGENLGNRAKVLSKLLDSMGYSKNIVKTAEDNLASIASTFSDMLGIINSFGGSETAIRSLNDIFNSKLEQAKLQIKTAEFDGRKILTGELGSDAIVRAKFNTKPVDVRKIGAGSYDLFETLGARSNKNIQINNDITKVKEGDTIRLENIVLTMMDAKNFDENNENHIAIGNTPSETAAAIVTAIKNHSSEALRIYDVFTNISDENSLVVIQQRSQSSSNISLSIDSPQAGMVDNSQPSNYSFELLGNSPTNGSKLTIYGVEFEYVNGHGLVYDPLNPKQAKVQIVVNGNNKFGPSAIALAKAIEAHPTTKKLVDKKQLSAIGNNFGVVTIKSTLDKSLLGFTTRFNVGDIAKDKPTISAVTTNAASVRFNTNPIDPLDIIRVVVAGQNYDFEANARSLKDVAPMIYNQMIEPLMPDGVTRNPLAQLITDGKLAIDADYNGKLTLFSDLDLKMKYIPASPNVNNAVEAIEPISPNDASVIKAAIDVSKISNIDSFIGTPKAEFRVIAQATGDAAATLYKQSTSEPTIPGGAGVNVDDSVAIIDVNIAGKTFQSTIWRSNAAGNLNNTAMVFKEGVNGESFTVRTRNFDADFTSRDEVGKTLAEPLRRLFESTVFAQTRDLEIDTSNEKIITDEGEVIGNVTGMTASLNSTDFTNKEINDFQIISNPSNANQALFLATISGVGFSAILDVAVLNEGVSVKLMADNGDSLTINVGKDGLNSLNDPQNYKYVSTAIKKSLMKIGSGIDVKMGLDSGDSLKLFVADMSVTKLYRNSKNEYVPKLDLLNKENVKIAQDVITNALNMIRSEQSNIHGQGKSIDQAADFLSSATAITKDASSGYLDTDLTESASAFSAALKSILAAISTLQAGARVADAGLEIIKSAAA
jgi:hypothetical protein